MRRILVITVAVCVAACAVSCKKESKMSEFGDSAKMLKTAEADVKKVPGKDAFSGVKENIAAKKEVKGLLERAITSRNEAEFCFAVGVNLAELQLYYTMADQEGSVALLKDSLTFFVKLIKARQIYSGDTEDLNAIVSSWSQRTEISAQELERDLDPFINNITNGIVQAYGDEGKINLAMGMYTVATVFSSIAKNVNAGETLKVFTAMKKYLEYKNARGTTYQACTRLVGNLSGSTLNYDALKNNAKTIMDNYML